jgi:hypothetical protein
MRLNASKKLFPLSAALALFFALSLAPKSALAGNEGGGLYSNGGSSEGGGIYSTGADNEGGGVYNTGATNENGGIFNNGSASQGGGVYNNGSTSEGGGAFNSGASTESGLGFYSYVPPNPHAWSTYSGPKAPPAWGAAPLSGSGGIASAGSEAEAKSTSAVPTDSIDYSNYKADTASHVHYYGR